MNLSLKWLGMGAWLAVALACGAKGPGGETAGEGESDTSSGSGTTGGTEGHSSAPTSGDGGGGGSVSMGESTSSPGTSDAGTSGTPGEEIPTDPGPYLPGIDGILVVEELRDFAGDTPRGGGPWAWAQFFNAAGAQGFEIGEVLDPFEGLEDCGVSWFDGTGFGGSDDITFLGADSVHIEVAGAMRTMEHGSDPFYHWLDLLALADDPQPGSRYAFEIRGGEVGDADVPGPTVPPELTITAPSFDAPIGRADLDLQWTGTGAAPLDLKLVIGGTPETWFQWTEVRCRMSDDGSFTIPAAVLSLVPDDGFASIFVARYLDEKQTAGDRTYLARGTSSLSIAAGFGDACESPPDNASACAAAAAQINAVLADCGQPAEPLAVRCPAFLADLCVDCTEYYGCFAAGWSCQPDGVHVTQGNCDCQ